MGNFKKNLVSVYSVNAINGVLGVVTVFLGLKFLGTKGYGLFSIYQILIAYAFLIDLGINKNIIKGISSRETIEEQRNFLTAVSGLYYIISFFLILCLPLFLFFIPAYIFPVEKIYLSDLRIIVVFSILEYLFSIPTTIRQGFSLGKEEFNKYSKFILLSGVYKHLIIISSFYIWGSAEITVVLSTSRKFIDFVVARRILGKLPKGIWRPCFEKKQISHVGEHSLGLTIPQILQSTVFSIGSVLVNNHFGLSALGIYRSAYDIGNRIWFISNGISIVVFPRFSRILQNKDSGKQWLNSISGILKISWSGYLLFSLVGILAGPSILKIFGYGDQTGLELFCLILFGVSLNAHSVVSVEFIQAAGKYKTISFLNLLNLFLMLITFFVLKNKMGILSMGWAWIVSQGVYSIACDALMMKVTQMSRKKQMNQIFYKIIQIISLSFLLLPLEWNFPYSRVIFVVLSCSIILNTLRHGFYEITNKTINPQCVDQSIKA